MSLIEQAEAKKAEAIERPQQVKLSASELMKRAVYAQTAEFETVLPKHVNSDRFSRLVLSAIKSTPDLIQCFNTQQGKISIFFAAMQAAALGLEPNTPTQECWLLPRRNKGVWECQLSIGFRGYIKLAIKNGQEIVAGVVREGDRFLYKTTLHRDVLEWEPSEEDNSGAPISHVFAIVRKHLPDGQVIATCHVMNREQVYKRRAMSDSWSNEKARPYSPWTKWEEEMWKKTAIRGLVPYMDLSPDAALGLANDEASFTMNEDKTLEAIPTDWTTEAIEAISHTSEKNGVADKVNPETGEVIEVNSTQTDKVDAEQAQTLSGGGNKVQGRSASPSASSKASASTGQSSQSSPPETQSANGPKDVLLAVFKEQGIRGPERFTKIKELTGFNVGSLNDLTNDQAQKVVDALDAGV